MTENTVKNAESTTTMETAVSNNQPVVEVNTQQAAAGTNNQAKSETQKKVINAGKRTFGTILSSIFHSIVYRGIYRIFKW